jgi:Eukaryotic initiation factor 4E
MSGDLDSPLPSGTWTLYFHAPREKRWTLDTFQPLAKVATLREILAVFNELGDKLKRGMFFCMRDPIPPLWENYQNIRGGSYSLRGGPEEGGEYYKSYVLGAMLGKAVTAVGDQIVGVSISPKIMSGPNGSHRVGFYVIKVWNKDSEAFNEPKGIHLLHSKLVPADILYTPHVDKKM